jgi:thymidylate synthase ThyX
MASEYHSEPFTDSEIAVLDRFFTNTTGPVFGLVNLPEVVKGALFARYSRSPKSLRRLFLDEFYEAPEIGIDAIAANLSDDPSLQLQRAEELYQRVFTQYGDDSVAQLGGVHLACEQASNVLTKVLEWGRLAAYLEQSTRYMFYDRPLGDRYRYFVPPEIEQEGLGDSYRTEVDALFESYSALTDRLTRYYEALYPQHADDSDYVYRSTIRAKVCDDLRGLLPAATTSNVGIYATGQSYEMLLLRMRASRLAEVREYADLMLVELRKMIPAFLRRVDVPERGGVWSQYLADTATAVEDLAAAHTIDAPERPEVTLVEYDPEAETKIAAAALYSVSDAPDDSLLEYVRALPPSERQRLFAAYVGERSNRRHRPGRAMERADYRFDILCDYGIFRDLQRHRMMTLEWQTLGTVHGYVTPESITELDLGDHWDQAMERAADHHRTLTGAVGRSVAQYAVPLAYRVRFFMQMNAREALHLLELRTGEGGHQGYRRVCQVMHRLIRDEAGHHLIADAMEFVDHESYGLGRLASERRSAAKRAAAGIAEPSV